VGGDPDGERVNLEYKGREEIPAPKERVWAFVTDPASIVSCMPDVISSNVVDGSAFDAVVQVAVGPVRGKFKFHVTLEPDPGGARMGMKIAGGGFGSVVDLLAGADVIANGDAATTLDWQGKATMRGPVATVGGRVLDAQANRIISTTFANVKTRLSAARV
jgi:carbon monoxide dehydrogenase subunit G